MPAMWWVVGAALVIAPETHPAGYLFLRPPRHPGSLQRQAVPYKPREGDLVFYDDHSRSWTALFALAGTGPPTHMGIVVKRPDGRPAVLEAGPDDTLWVRVLDLGPRLRQFRRAFRGTILVRRCKVTLNPEHSAALTRFALAQEGKRYAALRLLAQGTPLRARGPLAPLLAGTRLDRDAWFCSELAVAAGTVAGLFDPRAVRANATYPRDLLDDRLHSLHSVWARVARWAPVPGVPPRRARIAPPGPASAHSLRL
jgi:hypothetical protein